MQSVTFVAHTKTLHKAECSPKPKERMSAAMAADMRGPRTCLEVWILTRTTVLDSEQETRPVTGWQTPVKGVRRGVLFQMDNCVEERNSDIAEHHNPLYRRQ